jgi:prevent-host-death family protein
MYRWRSLTSALSQQGAEPLAEPDTIVMFSEIVQKAMLGEPIVVTKENRPVVKIVAIKPATRAPGTGKGIWMARDFNEPLADFAEYM